MQLLAGWDALQRMTVAVPRGAPDYLTNLYATRPVFDGWCAPGTVFAFSGDGAVIVLRADRDFFRVYHVAQDGRALADALRVLPAGQYTADIVARGDAPDPSCDAYAIAGFKRRAFLRRMTRSQVSGPPHRGDPGLAAAPGEAGEVAAFLERLLDPLVEQLPERSELEQAAREGRLFLVRQMGSLAGMLMYDRFGQAGHLRFWHVAPEAQGSGIGRRLMTTFLERCAGLARIVLWVMGDNDRSIAIYRHYGFETDGLLDNIMTLHKDVQQ